jgi:hypothetical protein
LDRTNLPPAPPLRVPSRPGVANGLAEIASTRDAAYPRDEVARLVIVPGKIANIVLR